MARRFPYVALHDLFPEHPKVALRSDAAFRVQVTGLCYCHRNLSDGFIPATVAHGWGRRAVRELVRAGMWVEVEGGYTIHDYLEWNDSREEIASKSESKRMAGAIGGASRWDSTRHSKTDSKRVAPRGNAVGSGSAGSSTKTRTKPGVTDAEFEEFWALCPRRTAKGAARAELDKAVAKVPLAEIMAAMRRFRDDPNLPTDRTKIPHPSTWLHQERWADDPLPSQNGQAPGDEPRPPHLPNLDEEYGS